jgi:glycosyltransferase involved in cell wall biosynthesis
MSETKIALDDRQGNDKAAPDLSIVIPVFQSATTLPTLMNRLSGVLERLQISHEIICVEDGSSDNSWAVLQELQKANPESMTVIRLTRNFGQHNALMCAFRYSRGRFVMTLDDDLQNPPEEIPKLLDAIREGSFDVVYGTPSRREQDWSRRTGSHFVRWFYRLVFKSDVQISSFRVINGKIARNLLLYDLNFTFVDGLLAWHTERIRSVEVEHQQRATGKSGYRVGKLLTLAFNLFTNFSLIPLQVVSCVGFLFACGGLLSGFYYLLRYVSGGIGIPGYASMIIAILVLGGIQLLSLGIIGEYVGRVHLNLNKKPQFVVRTIMSGEPIEGRENEAESDGRMENVL